MKKRFKGFTLIELIVVIAIIAVLAAILVPAMMGWVRKASVNSANANAKQVFTAAQTYMQELETQGVAVSADYSEASTVTLNGSTRTVAQIINDGITTSGTGLHWAFRVNQNVVTGAVFATGTKYTGGYPNSAPTSVANSWITSGGANLTAACATNGTGGIAGTSAWTNH